MTTTGVDLTTFNNQSFDRGRSWAVEALWRIVSALFFQCAFFPFYAPKRTLLRWFGAKIGKRVLIKPGVKITFPWKIAIGENSWIGEEAWLDSLDTIEIGKNVCISQLAYLCTGSHDATKSTFDLKTKPIYIKDGAWVGAGSLVAPGVEIGSHAFVTLGSVVTQNVASDAMVSGNPAQFIRQRILS